MRSCVGAPDDLWGWLKVGKPRQGSDTKKQNRAGVEIGEKVWGSEKDCEWENGDAFVVNFCGGCKKIRGGYCRFKIYAYLCSVETARR